MSGYRIDISGGKRITIYLDVDFKQLSKQAKQSAQDAINAAATAQSILTTLQPLLDDLNELLAIEPVIPELLQIQQSLTEIIAVFNNLSTINNVEQNLPAITSVESNLTELQTIFNNLTELLNIEANITAINNVEQALVAINNVNAALSEINTVSNNISDINTVATNIAAILTCATNIAAIIAAPQAAADAEAARDKAAEWADNPEDVPVETGPDRFSAFHWAEKAAAFFPGGAVAGDLVQFDGANWQAIALSLLLSNQSLESRIALGIDNAFVIRINTGITGAGTVTSTNQFQLTGAVGNYRVEAYQNNNLIANLGNFSGQQTLTLPNIGIYDLRIIPITTTPFNRISYDFSGDRRKLLGILNWGSSIAWETFNSSFYECNNLTFIPNRPVLSVNQTTMFRKYWGCNLNVVPYGYLSNLFNITNCQNLFRNNGSLSIPVGLFNNNPLVSNFTNCFLGTTLPVVQLSRLYIELEQFNTQNNVAFHGGSGQFDPNFTLGGLTTAQARAALIARGWTLTDGGSI